MLCGNSSRSQRPRIRAREVMMMMASFVMEAVGFRVGM